MSTRVLAGIFLLLTATAAEAAVVTPEVTVTGFYLTTKYPAMTVRGGEPTTIDLSLHDFNEAPQQFALSVPTIAAGWKAEILGGGQPVAAVYVTPNAEQALQLRLEPPAKAAPGDYRFIVEARSDANDLKLPLVITIGKELPAKLKLTTNFPALRGTASTAFKYTVTIENDSGRDATINLAADAPRDFQVTFTEAYGSQQITSLPIAAGKSKDVDMSVSLPTRQAAGDYRLVMHAKSAAAAAELPVSLTVTGQPRLSVSGEGGRLSGEAYAGSPSPLTIVLRNDGGQAAHDIELTATAPDEWKTDFDPKTVPVLAPGATAHVKVTMTPSSRAIAGDYQTTIRASSEGGVSDSANFRITVLTSTLWGAIGIAIIAAALLAVVFAVARFGRR
jgi:uncharacterized membrane protein